MQITHEVVIVGGGAAGIATAASLLARQPGLDIAVIEPADKHYYQPGWTMVGAGVFKPEATAHSMTPVMPRGVHWIKAAAAAFVPERNAVILDDGQEITYRRLVVCPGLKLNWQGIDGLTESLGRNGVTSNYRVDLAPYTWDLVQKLREGRALFTQPAMPIKCAGAPQKAMYLSADHWKRTGVLSRIEIEFCCGGTVLFGVPAYVPPLMEYVKAYGIQLDFGDNLTAIDGEHKKAFFTRTGADGRKQTVVKEFDMIHVVPPKIAPDFIRNSALADAAGWVDVDPATLRHKYHKISLRWATSQTRLTPRLRRRRASRLRLWHTICWHRSARSTVLHPMTHMGLVH